MMRARPTETRLAFSPRASTHKALGFLGNHARGLHMRSQVRQGNALKRTVPTIVYAHITCASRSA